MTKYEHKMMNSREFLKRQLGLEGWRVVGVAFNDLLILEREVR